MSKFKAAKRKLKGVHVSISQRSNCSLVEELYNNIQSSNLHMYIVE